MRMLFSARGCGMVFGELLWKAALESLNELPLIRLSVSTSMRAQYAVQTLRTCVYVIAV